jgi:hypothetical protein
MALHHSPRIVTSGLVLALDAADRNSYPGSGTTWTDLSGNNNGTLINSPTFNSGNAGSIQFDGVNKYVTLGVNKYQYQTNFSVEVFARFPNLPNNAGGGCGARHPIIYNHDYGYNLLIGSNGFLSFGVYNTVSSNAGASSLASVVGSNYFHAVGIKNGTNVSLHVNGIFQNSGNLTTNAVFYAGLPFVIGGFATCGSSKFYATGNISQVKVYNRALSSTEILQNYNATKTRFEL